MQKTYLVLAGFLLFSSTGLAQSNCVLKKDENDIKVYLCDSKIGKFKTIVVELDVPATLSQYAAAVLDISSYEEWQYKTFGTEVVKKVSKTELYYYSEIKTPWPTSNRDFIFHLRLNQSNETRVVTMSLTEMPDFVPKKEGVVRLPKANSILTLTPLDKENIRVRYVLDVDPGGEIPAWVSNMFAALAPWNTYNNLRNRLISQGKKRITVPFIEDF